MNTGTAADLPTRNDARDSFRHVLAASLLTLVLWFVPYVGIALYPIRLFVTYVHELCHAVASVLTGGWPQDIELYLNAAGVTHTIGGSALVISSAGYVGAPVVGAVLLLLSARRWMVRPALVGAGVILTIASVWLGGNVLALIGGIAIGVSLVAIGAKASPAVARFSLSFLALQCILNAIADIRYLFSLSVSSNTLTDAQNMAAATGGLVPAVVWTCAWAVIALVMLGASTWLYYRTTARHSLTGAGQPLLPEAQQTSSVNDLYNEFRLP
jgi:hypothetical protein